jgi:hypothetical protein
MAVGEGPAKLVSKDDLVELIPSWRRATIVEHPHSEQELDLHNGRFS